MKFSISKKIINNWHAALPYLLSNGEYVLEVFFLTKQCSPVLCEILNCMFNNAVGTRVKVDPLGILDKVKVIQIYICFWLLSPRVCHLEYYMRSWLKTFCNTVLGSPFLALVESSNSIIWGCCYHLPFPSRRSFASLIFAARYGEPPARWIKNTYLVFKSMLVKFYTQV